MAMSQLPDSQTSPQTFDDWTESDNWKTFNDFFRETTGKGMEKGELSAEELRKISRSLTMDSYISPIDGKLYSDESYISTTFDDKFVPVPMPSFEQFKAEVTASKKIIGSDGKPRCNKCKKGDDDKPLVECHDCGRNYHCNCHRPSVTEVELMDPRMIWYCAECSLEHKISIIRPKITEEPKESLKLTFCKYTSVAPVKNEKGEWVKGGSWSTHIKRNTLKSPAELFPSLMSAVAAADEPIAFQRKCTDPIRLEKRKLTPTGQPAGLAAWAAKLKAAKMAKKVKSKAVETVVRSTEEAVPLDSSAEGSKAGEEFHGNNDVAGPKSEAKPKRKGLDKRLAMLLADAKDLLGDSTPNGGRRTRSQTIAGVVKVEIPDIKLEEEALPESDAKDVSSTEVEDEEDPVIKEESVVIPAKRIRTGSRSSPVKKQLKLTINLTKEKVSFEEKEEPILKKSKKAKNKSEKHSSKRKEKESSVCVPEEGKGEVCIPRANPKYEDKSSECDELKLAYK